MYVLYIYAYILHRYIHIKIYIHMYIYMYTLPLFFLGKFSLSFYTSFASSVHLNILPIPCEHRGFSSLINVHAR